MESSQDPPENKGKGGTDALPKREAAPWAESSWERFADRTLEIHINNSMQLQQRTTSHKGFVGGLKAVLGRDVKIPRGLCHPQQVTLLSVGRHGPAFPLSPLCRHHPLPAAGSYAGSGAKLAL